ncbi:hypothetical protein OG381_34255 [Streptomyces sp. NBC_00490]
MELIKRAGRALYESQVGWTITSGVLGAAIGLFFVTLYLRAQ